MEKGFYDGLVKKAKDEGIERFGVGAIIKIDGRYLLLKRKKNDSFGGIYELPGGMVEEEESLDVAICREVMEETGLKIRKIKRHISSFDYQSRDGKKVRRFIFLVDVEPPFKIRLQEHENYIWTAEPDKYLITDAVKKIIKRV